MGRKKKEQQQESLKQTPVNETPEDGDSAEYEEMPDQSEQIMQIGHRDPSKTRHPLPDHRRADRGALHPAPAEQDHQV